MQIPLWIWLGAYFVIIYLSIYWWVIPPEKKKKKRITEYPTVTVVVPAKDEERDIRNSLESVVNQDYPKDKLEIYFVDDGSTDRTYQIMEEYKKHGINIIRHKKGKGKAESINEVLKIAKGEFFFNLDADIKLPKNALKCLMEKMEPGIGVAVTTVGLYDKSNFLQKLQKIEYNLSGLYRYLSGIENGLFLTHGGGCLFRTGLLKEIGGFDEDNPTEDLEIGMKIIKSGYRIAACNDILAKTNPPKNLKELYRQRMRWNVGYVHNMVLYWGEIKKSLKSNWVFFMFVNVFWILLALLLLLNALDELRVGIGRLWTNLVSTNFDFRFYFREMMKYSISIDKINIVTIVGLLAFVIFLGNYLMSMRKISKQKKSSWLLLVLFFGPYLLINNLIWIASAIHFVFKRQNIKWKNVEVVN